MTRALYLLTLLAVLWPASLKAQPLTRQETARVDQVVAGALAKSGAPSASVAVVRGG